MIPQNILRAALAKGLQVIGITDHNTAENVAAVMEAAEGTGITVIGGMEVTSAEEVHLLTLFDEGPALGEFQSLIYRSLHGSNNPEAFGYQWVVDAEGGVIDQNPRLLIGATTLTVHEVADAAHRLGGIVIAAHVDRMSFSVVSQLGFIPADLELDGVELSPFAERNGFGADALAAVSMGREFTVVRASDAHFLEDVGRSPTDVLIAGATVTELAKALAADSGRAVLGGV